MSGFYTKITYLSTPEVLFHHRWSIPVLAQLHRSSGSRFVTLAKGLGVSRESLRQTLGALVEAGLRQLGRIRRASEQNERDPLQLRRRRLLRHCSRYPVSTRCASIQGLPSGS